MSRTLALHESPSATRAALAGDIGAARLAIAAALLAAVAIAGAWAIQLSGYPPCELCLIQRVPYYVGVPLALLTALALALGSRGLGRVGLILLGLLFVASAALGVYHAGVEWQFWSGPTGCTGATNAPAAISDFLKQLDSVKVVRCDEAALRVLGLSLAGWNALVSAVIVILCTLAWRRLSFRRWA